MITFAWTNGLEKTVEFSGYESLRDLLDQHSLINDDIETRLFYCGKELPISLTTGLFNPQRSYRVIVYQKASQIVQNTKKAGDKNSMTPQQKHKKILMEEGAKITDKFYNRISMQQKADIQYQKSLQNYTNSKDDDRNTTPTVVDYETKISQEPLPFNIFKEEQVTAPKSSAKSELMDHYVVSKNPNGDASHI